jgi:hypothetical protein
MPYRFSTCSFGTTTTPPGLFSHHRPLTQAVVFASRHTTSAWPDHGSFSSPRTMAQNGQS